MIIDPLRMKTSFLRLRYMAFFEAVAARKGKSLKPGKF